MRISEQIRLMTKIEAQRNLLDLIKKRKTSTWSCLCCLLERAWIDSFIKYLYTVYSVVFSSILESCVELSFRLYKSLCEQICKYYWNWQFSEASQITFPVLMRISVCLQRNFLYLPTRIEAYNMFRECLSKSKTVLKPVKV